MNNCNVTKESCLGAKTKPYLLCSAICFVIWAIFFIWRWSVVGIDGIRYFCLNDDAMISMRYAWNLSHGFGLVWNPGEYVEGFTNPLMTLFMSLTALIFDKRLAPLVIQISGIIFMLVIAHLTLSVTDYLCKESDHRHRALFKVLTFSSVLFFYPLAYFSLTGMETGLLTILLLAGILLAFKYEQSQNTRKLFLMSTTLGLAYLTRADAAIPIGLIFAYFLYVTFTSKPPIWTLFYSFMAVGFICIFVVGYAIFRWQYYGEFVPNTYTLKLAGMPLAERMRNGLGYFKFALTYNIPILLLGGAGLFSIFRRQTVLFVTIAAALAFYQIWIGGDVYLGGRIILPVIPLMLALCVHNLILLAKLISRGLKSGKHLLYNLTGVFIPSLRFQFMLKTVLKISFLVLGAVTMMYSQVPEKFGILNRGEGIGYVEQACIFAFGGILLLAPFLVKHHSTAFMGISLTLLLVLYTNGPFLQEFASRTKPYFWRRTVEYTNLGVALDQITTPDATVGVTAAGIISYLSGRKSYDFLGKTDKLIAGLEPDYSGAVSWSGMNSVPGHNKYDLNYSIKTLCPTYVQKCKWGKQDLSEYVRSRYVLAEYEGLTLWLRKDSRFVLWDKIERFQNRTIAPTSQTQPQSWRYTTSKPGDGWERADFDDSEWQTGMGGFGTKGTPAATVYTEWKSSDIWLRRTFELRNTKPSLPQLLIHHDDDAEVYINGQLVVKLEGRTGNYVRATLNEKSRRSLKHGSNCIAVHCHQTTGGQYIDVGIIDGIEQRSE